MWAPADIGREVAYGRCTWYGAVQEKAVQRAAMRKGRLMWCCVKELLSAHKA